MTDVFISYSRRDKIFTQKLVDALQAANREVWADWNSIPAASDWDAEIKEGIEKTNTVLFLLSPEWIKSNECRKELLHALQMGKKLIPILYIMPDQGQEVPPELAKINWVYMRETDDFNKAFEILQNAMDTDLDWVKTHTRIQVRAIEWNKKNRDNSLTLRGNDLIESEQFISVGANKTPGPTSLQGEYILASRKDATRRQRITLTGVTVAMIVSIFLAVLAYFQWQAADLNAKIATSRELVANANSNLPTDPELSTLLAMESVKILQDADQPLFPEMQTALRTALTSMHLRYVKFDEAKSTVTAIGFSPDGSLIARSYYDGRIELLKVGEVEKPILGTGRFEKSIGLQPYKTLSTTSSWSIAFNPDGNRLATSASPQDFTPAVWDVETGELLFTLSGHSAFVRSVVFNPDGTRIATASEDGTVRVWDASNGKEITVISDHNINKGDFPEFNWVYALAFSPDGKALASAGGDQLILISNSETGETIKSITPKRFGIVFDIEFSPDGSMLAWGDDRGYINLFDLLTNTGQSTSADNAAIKCVSFSPDGKTLAGTGIDGVVTLLNLSDASPYLKLSSAASNDITAMSYSPDNKYIATGTLDGSFFLWDVTKNGGGEVNLPTTQLTRVTGLAFSPNGDFITTTGNNDGAHILDIASVGNPQKEILPEGLLLEGLSFSSDGTKALIAAGWDGASLFDVKTWKLIKNTSPAEHPGLYLDAVDISSDGKLIAGGFSNNNAPIESLDDLVIVWDAQTGAEIKTLLFKSRQVHAVDFSPNGKFVAAGGDDTTVKIVEVNGSSEPITLSGHTDWLRAVNFSPDSKWLVSGGFDLTAIVWDATTGDKKMTLKGHTAVINDAKFSPDGSLIALASGDGTATIWNAETGELLYRISPQAGELTKLDFSPDGKLIALGGDDGSTRIYFLDFNSVLALAQSRITRSLTDFECNTYLHQDACPSTILQPQPTVVAGELIRLHPIDKASNGNIIAVDQWAGSNAVAAPSPEAGIQEAAGLKSGSETTPVVLKILNNTGTIIKLNWVDFEGVEQVFMDIADGESLIDTFSSHAWRLRDPDGNLIFECVATDQAVQEITINADLTVTAK